MTYFPKQLKADLDNTLGPDWNKSVRKVSIPKEFCLADIEKIETNLRLLIPLSACLKVAGLGQAGIDMLYRYKDKNPSYRYVFDRFAKASAEGEAAALAKLSSPNITMKEATIIQWQLERCLDDTYSPRTKNTKVVNQSASVTVSMKLPPTNTMKPLLQSPIIDVDIVPDVIESNQN
jgi:hypothetical protein